MFTDIGIVPLQRCIARILYPYTYTYIIRSVVGLYVYLSVAFPGLLPGAREPITASTGPFRTNPSTVAYTNPMLTGC